MLAPKGFTQNISKEAYLHAHKVAQAKTGMLRFQLPLMFLAAAFAAGGTLTFLRGIGIASYAITAEVLFALSVVTVVLILWLPRREGQIAAEDYRSFAALSDPAQVVFDSDEMLIKSDKLTHRVEYAKTRLCIETDARFVILTDDDAMVILETSCFEDSAATVAFLRDVFARWYKRG